MKLTQGRSLVFLDLYVLENEMVTHVLATSTTSMKTETTQHENAFDCVGLWKKLMNQEKNLI